MDRTLEVFREHRGIASIPEVFFKSVEDFGSRGALSIFRDGAFHHLTYEELGRKVRWLASGLRALGFSRGDRCAILGPNSPEWALAYLSILSTGGICVPTDSLLKGYDFRHIFAEAGVGFIFVASKFLETVLEIDEELELFKKIILFEETHGDLPQKVTSIPQVLEKGRKHPKELRFPKLDEVAAIIYTSGTTGKAKGVMLTHRNIVSDVVACYQSLPFDHEDRFLSVLPMHHTFECTAGFLLPLYAGAHITFARSLKSRDILEDLKASRITVMLGVPLLFQKLYEGIERAIRKVPLPKRVLFHSLMRLVRTSERFGRAEAGRILFRNWREKAGLAHLRFFVSGGAPLPPHLSKAFRRLGIKLIQGYGLTEASPVLTVNPPEAPKDESVGLPLPGVEVRVRDPNPEGVGELCFRGPMIMKGYYENTEATRAAFDEDGFLQTGDLGYVDEEGYVHICGRVKNLIVTPAGKNVYPEEIEAELDKSPYILESMVFGFPKDGGEEVWAVIVPDYEAIERDFHGKHLREEDVESLITREARSRMSRLADYKRVKRFLIRDEEFPKTSTRKIKRHLVIPKVIAHIEKQDK